MSSISHIYYTLDALIFARVLYTFSKSYFRDRIAKEDRANALAAPASAAAPAAPPRAPVRIYMDGCFDMMHFGHANALRQAKALGDVLVVGLIPDSEIREHKGPPVMNDNERYVAVAGVKWVDEVLTDVPYDLTPEFVQRLLEKERIDFIVHGDDPCISKDGRDAYEDVKKAGKFVTIKRTEGVSSTDIVGRMLLCTTTHHMDKVERSTSLDDLSMELSEHDAGAAQTVVEAEGSAKPKNGTEQPFTRVSNFLPTTRRLIQFAGEARKPKPTDKVVYMDGSFDMFHCGHVETLKAAKEMGDFLLVGIHDDATVNARLGHNFPILNLHERTLSVLSCRYVDEVIIGAPPVITNDMIVSMNISHVCRKADPEDPEPTGYDVPKEMGIYHELRSDVEVTVKTILDRIVAVFAQNRESFSKKHARKVLQEQSYFEQKEYVEEL